MAEFVRVATPTGSSAHAAAVGAVRAECGVRITPVDSGKPFDPELPIACTRCVEFMALRSVDTQ